MSDQIEGRPREIIEAPNVALLAIPRGDGTVQSVVVWADHEDGAVTVNSSVGRAWPAALERAGRATVTVLADGGGGEWVSVETHLAKVTPDPGFAHIDALSNKYLGTDYPFKQPGEQRVRFDLAPDRVFHFNRD